MIMVTTDPAEPIKAAVSAHHQAAKRAEQTLAALHAAIAEAASQGVRQTDLVEITGYTRERIRQTAAPARSPSATTGAKWNPVHQ